LSTDKAMESWKKFCQTGAVSDYLAYRSEINSSENHPPEFTASREVPDAAENRRHSDTGAQN